MRTLPPAELLARSALTRLASGVRLSPHRSVQIDARQTRSLRTRPSYFDAGGGSDGRRMGATPTAPTVKGTRPARIARPATPR